MTTFTFNGKKRTPRITLKQMVRRGEWERLGTMFDFTPVFMETAGGHKVIDWRSVPARLYTQLQKKQRSQVDLVRFGRTATKASGLITPIRQPTLPVPKKPKKRLRDRSHRERLYLEQNGECHYCGRHVLLLEWTVDHRIPLSRGGTNYATNLVGACESCNGRKTNLTEEEFIPIMTDSRACKALHARIQANTADRHK